MITKKTSIEYSLIKWKHAMDTGCNDTVLFMWLKVNHHKISMLKHNCGLCDKYMVGTFEPRDWNGGVNCGKCPLYRLWGVTCEGTVNDNLFYRWYHAKTKKTRFKYATIIYNDIKSLQG